MLSKRATALHTGPESAAAANRPLPLVLSRSHGARSHGAGRARHGSNALCRRSVAAAAEPGVQSLLERDRKIAGLSADELPAAFLDEAEPATTPAEGATGQDAVGERAGRKSKKSKGRASRSSTAQEAGPKTAGEAIEAGIARLQDGQAQAAVDLFQAALELPGNGAFRLSGTVREYRCPSDAEEQSALYNMACAYVAMGKADSALTCLEACLEAGFEDFKTLREDPDLAALRGPQMDKLLGRYDGLLAKVFKRRQKPGTPGKRPWYEVI